MDHLSSLVLICSKCRQRVFEDVANSTRSLLNPNRGGSLNHLKSLALPTKPVVSWFSKRQQHLGSPCLISTTPEHSTTFLHLYSNAARTFRHLYCNALPAVFLFLKMQQPLDDRRSISTTADDQTTFRHLYKNDLPSVFLFLKMQQPLPACRSISTSADDQTTFSWPELTSFFQRCNNHSLKVALPSESLICNTCFTCRCWVFQYVANLAGSLLNLDNA